MNAPFKPARDSVRLVTRWTDEERHRINGFLSSHPQATPFHAPRWLEAVAAGTGNRAIAMLAERADEIVAYLPLNEIHSPIFGRVLASSGFAVDGGLLLAEGAVGNPLFAAVEELAQRLCVPSIELRGGALPENRSGWTQRNESHAGFVAPLAVDEDSQLASIPRKQRAEVRKSLSNPFEVDVGRSERDRAAHYAVYAESVRNLGTPVFPRALFDRTLDAFGSDTDILTVRHEGRLYASIC